MCKSIKFGRNGKCLLDFHNESGKINKYSFSTGFSNEQSFELNRWCLHK